MIDVSGFAEAIWKHPLKLEVVVGKKHDGKDDDCRIVIAIVAGATSTQIFASPETMKIAGRDAGIIAVDKILTAVLNSIPSDHQGMDWVLNGEHKENILRDIAANGHSMTWLWGETQTAPVES